MSAVFVGVLAICAGGVFAALLAVGRKRCPACSTRGLTLDLSSQGKVRSYTCQHCRREWVSYDRGGLISREAFDAGARAPLPQATIHREGDDR